MLGTLLATFMAPASAFARVLYAIQEQKEQTQNRLNIIYFLRRSI